jgi:hypothetical protein
MKPWLAVFIFISMTSVGATAAAKGPEVDLVDNKLSINAEAVSLGRLIQLVDRATGMTSKVPPELANRNISVQFSGLNLTDGVRKIFQGQPLDYIMIQGQGIVVKAPTSGGATPESQPAYNPPALPQQQYEQPFIQEFPGGPPAIQPAPGQQPQQPAMIQTPFGAMPNPRAQQPQQVGPLTAPGQQNSLFPQNGQQPNTSPVIGVPGTQQIGNPTPFGTPSTFGNPNQPATNPNPNNGLFGNAPPVFGSQQPR